MKQTLAFDMDEVLFPFLQEFSAYHNQAYGSNVSVDHFTSYKFEETLGTSATEMVRRVYEFHGIDDLHVKPLDEAEQSLTVLSQDHELVVVTARDPQFAETTKAWIDHYFTGLFSDVVMVGYPDRMKDYRSKAQVCSDLGVVALVDDSLDHVKQCAEYGVKGILFGDYSWTSDPSSSQGVLHCKDWSSLVEHLGVRT